MNLETAEDIREEFAELRDKLRKSEAQRADALDQRDAAYKLLDRWVYGIAATEDLRQLCEDTVRVLPPDTRPSRFDQVAFVLSELLDARRGK